MDVIMSPIRIMDAAKIKAQHLLDRVTDDVPAYIRSILSDIRKRFFIASVSSEQGEVPFAIMGLDDISLTHRNAALIVHYANDDSSLEDSISMDCFASALDRLVRLAFFEMNLHRVTMLMCVEDDFAEQIANRCHLQQEAILEDALHIEDHFVDAALFSLLDSDYPDYSVGFVPFRKGVLAIRGDNHSVESTKFFSYGEKLEDSLERNVAIRTGIADDSGILKSADDESYRDLLNLPFPDEVSRCMQQMNEYFAKRRTVFTVHAVPLFGSDFQKRVWEKVAQIPYGDTVSYEDVALALTGGDKTMARNLTRAVGAACGENPLPLLIPCHRVIGKDGRLVGFSAGLPYKEFLLNHEMFGIHVC